MTQGYAVIKYDMIRPADLRDVSQFFHTILHFLQVLIEVYLFILFFSSLNIK